VVHPGSPSMALTNLEVINWGKQPAGGSLGAGIARCRAVENEAAPPPAS